MIPARFASTRLPGKPLAEIHGKPMIQHVHERVSRARRVDRVLVATDDERIAAVVRGFDGEAVMTSTSHPTGTDRVAEAAGVTQAEIIVNVQGDEPMLDPAAIDASLEPLLEDAALPIATLSLPLRDREEWLAPSVVKVLVDAEGNALYFSRNPIPHVRSGGGAELDRPQDLARKHVGLYAFRRSALLRFAALPPAPLERAEGLEQLRALYHGLRIHVVPVAFGDNVAVDTPEDLVRVRELMAPERSRMKEKGCRPSTSS